MRGLWLRIGGIAAVITLFIGVMWFRNDLCGNDFIYEKVSPGKVNKIVVFHRSCGATTGVSTQASLMRMNDKLANNSGNLFRASDKQTTSGKVELEWLDDRNLVVKHSKSIELYHDSNDVNGVHVVFETY